MLCLARPCGAWVVFDGKRLEQAVPLGQRAKNSSDVLTAAETMRLFLSEQAEGGITYLNKAKSKSKGKAPVAPEGSVASDLGF